MHVGFSTDIAHPYSFTASRMSRSLLHAGFECAAPCVVEADRVRAELLWICTKPQAR